MSEKERRKQMVEDAMTPKVYIFINGILNKDSSITAFTDVCNMWCQKKGIRSDRFEYECDAIFRRLGQNARVKTVIQLVQKYAGFKVHLVGHSNGCDIICRIVQSGKVKLAGIHLVAGAAEASFIKNGINKAVEKGMVGRITVFASKNDHALQKAKSTEKWLSIFGLGYGSIGLTGPLDLTLASAAITRTIWRNELDHSEWFKGKHLDELMEVVTA